MQPTEPIPRAVDITRPAGIAGAIAHWEARRLHHPYRGPEHLLIGLLRQGDNLAARVLVAHGLDLETVRAEVDRLIAQGVLPGPHLGDAAPLATLGIDLEAVAGRLKETFGEQAYWQATERVRNRPAQAATHRPMGVPPPFICARVFNIAAHEAIARDQQVGPEHLLPGLLRDAEDPRVQITLGLVPIRRAISAVTTLVTVSLMTWVVMPRVTRLLRGWLYPGRRR